MSAKLADNLVKSLSASLTQANKDVTMIRRASNLARFLEQRHTQLAEKKVNSVYEYIYRELKDDDDDTKQRYRATFRSKIAQKCSGVDDNGKKLVDQPSVLTKIHNFTTNNGLNIRLDILETDCDFASGSPYTDLIMLLLNACPLDAHVQLFAKEVVDAVKAFESLETQIDNGDFEDEDEVDVANITTERTRSKAASAGSEAKKDTNGNGKKDDVDDDDSVVAEEADEGDERANEAKEAEELFEQAIAKRNTVKLTKSENMLKIIDDLFYVNLKLMFDQLLTLDFFRDGYDIQDSVTAQKKPAAVTAAKTAAKAGTTASTSSNKKRKADDETEPEKRRVVDIAPVAKATATESTPVVKS